MVGAGWLFAESGGAMALRTIGVVLLAVSVAAGVWGCKKEEAQQQSVSAAPAADTVRIGFLGALTGDVAMVGAPTLQGMQLAAEEVNAAGGVLGKKVEIVEADNRG